MGFDFTNLGHYPPKGCRVVKADKTGFDLEVKARGVVFHVTSTNGKEFTLEETSHGHARRFLLRTDSLARVLYLIGYKGMKT